MLPITLLLPIRNGAEFINGIMPALISNADVGDEILVIEDGSTDQTLKLLQSWSSRFLNIRVISTGGIGLVKALNLGFSESKNEWVARFDADDTYPDSRLTKQRQLISENVSAIFADYSIYLNGTKFSGTIPSPVTHLATLFSLIYSQQTAHPVALINRDRFQLSGGYIESEFPAEDLGLWVRMAKFGELISCPEVLLSYRLSRTSISATRRSQALQKKTEIVKKVLPLISKDFASTNEVQKAFNLMSNLPLEVERKILFLRNLNTFVKNTGKENRSLTKGLPYFYLYLVTHLFKVTCLAFYQYRRNRFRKI